MTKFYFLFVLLAAVFLGTFAVPAPSVEVSADTSAEMTGAPSASGQDYYEYYYEYYDCGDDYYDAESVPEPSQP